MSLADVTANLRAPVETATDNKPLVKVHAVEWAKIMAGEPVEINPSIGHGYKVMSVKEWAARWKPNEAYPECLVCGSHNTKEHHFTQVGGWGDTGHAGVGTVACSCDYGGSGSRTSFPRLLNVACRRGAEARRSGRARPCAWTATASPSGLTATRTSRPRRTTRRSAGR